MAYASEPDFLVLHTLRIRGFAETEVVADATGLPLDEVTKRLDGFDADALVKYRAGSVSGWTLTAAGRREDEERASAELETSRNRAVVEADYRTFLVLNPDLLQLCTDWQMRGTADGPVVNDHADATYDRAVVDRLIEIDATIQPVCEALATALERFDGYGDRLASAVAKVVAGEIDWFSKPTIDSYHTVWFELHENLLATLGIERGKETS